MNELDTEYNILLDKWKNFVWDNFDVHGIFPDNKPYSLDSCKYHIYSDEILMSDPYGYYSTERPVFGFNSPQNAMYSPDIPVIDDMWAIPDLEKGDLINLDLTIRKDM